MTLNSREKKMMMITIIKTIISILIKIMISFSLKFLKKLITQQILKIEMKLIINHLLFRYTIHPASAVYQIRTNTQKSKRKIIILSKKIRTIVTNKAHTNSLMILRGIIMNPKHSKKKLKKW
jgi:hypothetical protein